MIDSAGGDDAGDAKRPASASAVGAASAAQLFEHLYRELHRLARSELRRHPGVEMLGATTLLHEAYLQLSAGEASFTDRGRFFSYAARAMRGLIVDYLRERRAIKRGGEFVLTSIDTVAEDVAQPESIERLKDALDELDQIDAPLAQLVDLKFFCGLSFAEVAALREVSERTVQRDWRKARMLLRELVDD